MTEREKELILLKEKRDRYVQLLEQSKHDLKHRKSILLKGHANVALQFGRFILPFVLVGGLATFAYMDASHHNPFSRKEKKYSTEKTTFDSNGNRDTDTFYDLDQNFVSNIYLYSKWEQKPDGSYTRTVKRYNINSKNIKEIITGLDKEDLELEDIFEKPSETMFEDRKTLSEDELSQEAYYSGVIYNVDKKDAITFEEPASSQFKQVMAYTATVIIGELFLLAVKGIKLGVDFEFDPENPKELPFDRFMNSLDEQIGISKKYDKTYLKECIKTYLDNIQETDAKIKKL